MKQLTRREVNALFPSASKRTYPKGQIVFYPEDKPDSIYFLLKGTVKYYDIDDSGNEKIVHLLGSGSFFPMSYTFDGASRLIAFYGALDDAEVLMIPRKDFVKTLRSDLKLANKTLQAVMDEMGDIIKHINSMSKTDARSKVLYVLEYLLSRHSHAGLTKWRQVNFPVNQQTIADFAGLTRETVSGIMQEFEAEKLIRVPKLLLLDINKDKMPVA